MYKLKKEKRFKRIFEEMGDETIFFKIMRIPENNLYHIHLLYYDTYKKEVHFDVAINESDFGIEYIKFFLSYKFIEEIFEPLEIVLKEENIYFKFKEIPKYHMFDFKLDFSNFLFQNNLIILKKEYVGEIYGYRLADDNYILMDKNDNIIGIYLKNLSKDEMNSLKK